MKKLFLISLFLITALAGFSQTYTPRFGITPNDDNTGRALTYKYVAISQAAGVDTLKLKPNGYETIINTPTALNDSICLQITSTTTSKAGDKIFISLVADGTARKFKFTGTNIVVLGTATVAISKRATIVLVFDGTKWVEVSRYIQA